MKASEFFSNQICDNQISPLRISELIHPTEDFYCSTYYQQNKENIRANAISKFLKDTRREIENIDLNEYNISYLIDDGEFDLNRDNIILNITGDTFNDLKLSTSNIVGSLNINGHQLNINSRFGNQFLAYMISNTSGFIELENFGSISNKKGLGEWILLLYWKNCLKLAFAQGIFKTYQKKRENLATVRGSIDINHWIKKQDYFDGRTLCEFKEHSFDNNINKVVSLAINKVSKSPYADLLYDAYDIKRAFQSIPFKNLNLNFKESVVSNPFYKNYNEVFGLSKRILQDQFMSFSSSDSNFSAFLFDISLLFEHHIRKVLKKQFTLRPKDLAEFRVPNGVNENKIFPDVIIDYGNNEIGIFDVKYKRFQKEGISPGVKREDKFQLISYIAMYSSKYKVINSGIIYPCEEADYQELKFKTKNNQIIKISNNDVNFGVFFYKVSDDLANQHLFDQEFSTIFQKTNIKSNVKFELPINNN